MRSTNLLVVIPALALALAGCKKEGIEGPLPGCLPVSFTSQCSEDAQCCSFGCAYGTCMPNPIEGGVCNKHGDCQAPMLCVGQRCKGGIQCIGGAVPTACVTGVPCCSGACTNGYCPVDTPPTAVPGPAMPSPVPWHIPIQLTNASTDAQTGSVGLTYLWEVVSAPAGSTATFQPHDGFPTPVFTPDAVGTYTIRLTASNAGGSGVATLTFTAVNTVPAVSMPGDIEDPAYQSRNIALTFSATLSDDDGGPVTCTWTKTSPSLVTTHVSGPTTCAAASGAKATGTSSFTLNEDEAGTWALTLSVDDSVNPIVSTTRFVNVQNDPPVANAGPKRYGNLSLASIPLNGTATDINGDVGNGAFTWRWTVSATPGGIIPIGYEVGTTPSVNFVPDAEGTYILTLTVDDGRGGPLGDTDSADVEVQVEPYILPLAEVADAEYVDAADRIVVVETDRNAYQLRIVDPATLEVKSVVTLAAKPTTVALAPGGAEALVGEVGGRWEKVTGIPSAPVVATTVPATPGVALPADLVDIAHAGVCAYGMTGSGTVYRLYPEATTAPFWADPSGLCPTCSAGNQPLGMRTATGTATVEATTAPWLWLLQTGSGRLGRYEIHNNCDLRTPSVQSYGTLQGTRGLWLSADAADLYTTRTTVYDATSALLVSRVNGLPLTPDHLKTTLVSSSVVGAVAQYATSALATFSRDGTPGSVFTQGSSKAFPILGEKGDPKTNYGRYAFVRPGGGAYYAVVRANVGTEAAPVWKWGLVNLGP